MQGNIFFYQKACSIHDILQEIYAGPVQISYIYFFRFFLSHPLCNLYIIHIYHKMGRIEMLFSFLFMYLENYERFLNQCCIAP